MHAPKVLYLALALGGFAVAGATVLPATTALAQRSLTHDDTGDSDHEDACMTSYMLRNFLAQQGYENIKLNAPARFWQARATRGNATELLVVDTCGHRIVHSAQVG